MAGDADAAEKLRNYLRALKPGARALLIAELERGVLHGTSPEGAELVLSELRRSLRDGATSAARVDDAARLFFAPIEPFLVDDAPEHNHRGRISRSLVEPLWVWIGNTLLPDDTREYSTQVEQALTRGETDQAEMNARTFQDRVVSRIAGMLEGSDDKERRRLTVQLGTSRALEDVQALRRILSERDALSMLATQLPGHVTALTGPVLENVKMKVDATIASKPDRLLYSLIVVLSKLAAPWQLIRLAVKAAGGDTAKKIVETPYSVAVHIALEEVDRRVRELAVDLKSGRGIAVSALLKEVHDSLRGLRSEIDMGAESPWGKQLVAVRAEVSKILTAEIELMPGRVRRLIRPRASKEIAPGTMMDAGDVAETEALIGFVTVCRNYASELAINEVTQRVLKSMQQALDTGTRTLLDGLRGCPPAERAFRQSQVDAAVRFCAKIFGQEYAALLAKAAEVARHDNERKAAKA